jgi:hypothetical protein
MSIWRVILSVILFLVGIVSGIYVGFWLMLVGGFIDIVTAIKEPIIDVSSVGFGLLKIVFSGVVGTITFWFFTLLTAISLIEV